jgi:hypothetical protein
MLYIVIDIVLPVDWLAIERVQVRDVKNANIFIVLPSSEPEWKQV